MLRNEYNNVAVIIPCFNEESTISKVVQDFKSELPGASIYVFDNNSNDKTAINAKLAGAFVINVAHKGKGNVVRRMFADIEASYYLLVDGDDTYDARSSSKMIYEAKTQSLDMVVGCRVAQVSTAYRFGHTFGNILLTHFMSFIFGKFFTDMLSGYRVFSRRFVKSFPANSSGFEIETEFTIHSLELKLPVKEISTPYFSRPVGSFSKLNTFKDGFKILKTIITIYRLRRPIGFYSIGFWICTIFSFALGYPLFFTYLDTGLVPRLPTLVLCSSLIILSVIFLICGYILDAISRGHHEVKRFAYLFASGK